MKPADVMSSAETSRNGAKRRFVPLTAATPRYWKPLSIQARPRCRAQGIDGLGLCERTCETLFYRLQIAHRFLFCGAGTCNRSVPPFHFQAVPRGSFCTDLRSFIFFQGIEDLCRIVKNCFAVQFHERNQ